MIIHLLLCALLCFLVLHTVFWWTTLKFVVPTWTIGTVYAHTRSEMNKTSHATIEFYTPLRQSQPRLPGFALLSVVRIWDVCCTITSPLYVFPLPSLVEEGQEGLTQFLMNEVMKLQKNTKVKTLQNTELSRKTRTLEDEFKKLRLANQELQAFQQSKDKSHFTSTDKLHPFNLSQG